LNFDKAFKKVQSTIKTSQRKTYNQKQRLQFEERSQKGSNKESSAKTTP